MSDLIERDPLIAEYDRVHKGPAGGARKLMEDAPAVANTDDLISRADAIRLLRYELEFLGSRDTNAAISVIEKMPAAGKKD